MFRKILICLDGSPLAEQILPFAEAQALGFNSEAVLLQAFDVSTPISAAVTYASMTPGVMEKALSEEEKKARDYLAQVARDLRQKGIAVKEVALHGPAGSVILRYAEHESIDLIAIATHGRSGLGRAVFGSIADHILCGSGLPVLLIRPQEKKPEVGSNPFKKILVCLDGSKLAEQILPYATEEARIFSSQTVLLQAYALSNADVPEFDSVLIQKKEQTLRADALSYLEQVAAPMKEKGLDIISLALPGVAAEAILSYAHNNGVGLIAIATHGRSGLGRAVFGSVADHVLRESGLPILLIRPK